VKLLFDENLSRRLVDFLADLYPGSTHVSSVELLSSPDVSIWEFARTRSYTIVTADADFFELSTMFGPPPKVVWLRRWGYSTRDAVAILRGQMVRILEFCADPSQGLLVLEHKHGQQP
jgi:predicted nuclease of predicted toxin-antitoxin system